MADALIPNVDPSSSGSGGSIAYVGGSSNYAAAASTVQATYSASAGNFAIVTVGFIYPQAGPVPAAPSVSDNASGGSSSYTLKGSVTSAAAYNGFKTAIYTFCTSATGAKAFTAVTATCTDATQAIIMVAEYSGVQTIGATATNDDAGGRPWDVSLTTTYPSARAVASMVSGAAGAGNSAPTIVTGTLRVSSFNGVGGALSYAIGDRETASPISVSFDTVHGGDGVLTSVEISPSGSSQDRTKMQADGLRQVGQ